MDQIRVRTQDSNVGVRTVPIANVLVTATTSGGANTVLTVRDGVLLKVRHFCVVNTTGTPATLTLHSVPSGGSIAAGNAEFLGYSIGANDSVNLTDLIGQVYEAGTTLMAFSGTGSSLVVHGWAEEIL